MQLTEHAPDLTATSLRDNAAELIPADAVAFTVTFKIILDNTCRIDKISIPCPVTIMIITLLEIV